MSCVCTAYECAPPLQRRLINRQLNTLVKAHGLLHPHLIHFHTFRIRHCMQRQSCTLQEACRWNQQHPRKWLRNDQRLYQKFKNDYNREQLRWAKQHPVMWEAWKTKNLMQLRLLHQLIQRRKKLNRG